MPQLQRCSSETRWCATAPRGEPQELALSLAMAPVLADLGPELPHYERAQAPWRRLRYKSAAMLDIAFIRHNPDVVRSAVTNKRLTLDVDALLEDDRQRRSRARGQLDDNRARTTTLSAAIPKARAAGYRNHYRSLRCEASPLDRGPHRPPRRMKRLDDLMLRVPSIPRPEVPIGKGEEDNVEVRKVGTPRTFDSRARGSSSLSGWRRSAWKPTGWAACNRRGQRSYALMREGAR